MANIISFKTRQQLETEKALKTMREWEEYLDWEDANWEKVGELEENKERLLSIEEIKWLTSWVNERI